MSKARRIPEFVLILLVFLAGVGVFIYSLGVKNEMNQEVTATVREIRKGVEEEYDIFKWTKLMLSAGTA